MTTKITFPGFGSVSYAAGTGNFQGYTLATVSSAKLADAISRHQDNGTALDKAKRWVGEIYDCAPELGEHGMLIVDRAGDDLRHA